MYQSKTSREFGCLFERLPTSDSGDRECAIFLSFFSLLVRGMSQNRMQPRTEINYHHYHHSNEVQLLPSLKIPPYSSRTTWHHRVSRVVAFKTFPIRNESRNRNPVCHRRRCFYFFLPSFHLRLMGFEKRSLVVRVVWLGQPGWMRWFLKIESSTFSATSII